MPLVNDLIKIQTVGNSKNYAFEELCCQLASLEPRPAGSEYYRKGPGNDAGIECFIRYSDGSETGWQAKFFDKFTEKQLGQLSESFNQALVKHPRLEKYIVCFPIDLKDGRTGRQKTELQRWLDWKEARQLEAQSNDRIIHIELWDASSLRERLFRNDPYYSGRIKLFFSEAHFSPSWFKQQFELTKEAFGERYTPQFNVTLPIRQTFNGLSRDESLELERDKWIIRLHKKLGELKSIKTSDLKPFRLTSSTIEATKEVLIELTKEIGYFSDFPLKHWEELLQKSSECCMECLREYWALDSENSKAEQELIDSARRKLSDLLHTLQDILESLQNQRWQLVNQQVVLLHGEAGIGKSHLLADITKDYIIRNQPAILLMNSQFFQGDPRTQILERLDLRDISFATLLGALDAAGQMAGVRALLMIDAINERHGIELWKEHLALLITEVKRFKHIALIVSCRDTYLEFIIPNDSPLSQQLTKVQHHGFEDGSGHYARTYLAQRNIVRPSAPNLLPEFNNPLFLKTCCESLNKQGLRAFPKGLQGITKIFGFYQLAAFKEINDRMKLDKRQRIVERGLNKLIACMVSSRSAYIPLEQAITCLDEVYPSHGLDKRSLLNEFEHSGLLSIEPVYQDGVSGLQEQVRFTFERFSDFEIATHILNQHIEEGHPIRPLPTKSPLHEIIHSTDYRTTGILGAIAVIMPEKHGIEVLDLLNDESAMNWRLENAFEESLLLRKQESFTDRTRELISSLEQDGGVSWLQILIAISTEPDNPFNADYLHTKLSLLPMPERDSKWSIGIARLDIDDGEPLDILISWATESGMDEIEDKRAELAAIILTWLLSTSHRKIRDRATKGLTALLAPRLPLASLLLDKFQAVDDLYIQERLMAAIYGAVLQAKTFDGLDNLARQVYARIFESSKPPVHLLLRDHARGIIEYTLYKELDLPTLLPSKIRPPYQSEWPLEFLTEADIEKYTRTINGMAFKDDIVQSAGSEWTGDFAKYIIKPAVVHWSSTLLSKGKAQTSKQRFDDWLDLFESNAQPEQIEAFSVVFEFCLKCFQYEIRHRPSNYEKTNQNEEIFKIHQQKFLGILDLSDRIHYKAWAKNYLKGLVRGFINNRPEEFSVSWSKFWVVKRAHDLGWTNELFQAFDDSVGTGRGRTNKHIERIGKKYQRIALYELLARLSDNLAFMPEYGEETSYYDGPWQLLIRDIDPSLLVRKTQYDGWRHEPAVWWSPKSVRLKHLSRQEQSLWLETEQDQLNDAALVDIVEPETGKQWLSLSGLKHYYLSTDSGLALDTWCRISCVLVKRSDVEDLVSALSRETLRNSHDLPNREFPYKSFLGEYPWHSTCRFEEDWLEFSVFLVQKKPPILPTVTEYTAEQGSSDYSLDEYISFHLPAQWLIRELNLRLSDGRTLKYIDAAGNVIFRDPSTETIGPSVALIDKAVFLSMLQKNDLEAVWVIAGEKGAYGESHDDFVGRRIHSFLYRVIDGSVTCVNQLIEDERPHSSH